MLLFQIEIIDDTWETQYTEHLKETENTEQLSILPPTEQSIELVEWNSSQQI